MIRLKGYALLGTLFVSIFIPLIFAPIWPKISYFAPFQTDKNFNTKFPNSFPFHFTPPQFKGFKTRSLRFSPSPLEAKIKGRRNLKEERMVGIIHSSTHHVGTSFNNFVSSLCGGETGERGGERGGESWERNTG